MFKQQRRLAYMIREADTVELRTEDDKANEPAPSLRLLYHDIKAELKGAPTSKSLHCTGEQQTASKRLVRSGYRYDDVKKFVEKLKNAERSLFTFVMHNVDSNNAAERVLREVVIHRKIRGLLRNEKGYEKMFGNIMTVLMTWKLRGMNPLGEVRKYL